MDLHDIPTYLKQLKERYPTIRGRAWEFAALSIGDGGDGDLEAWFTLPKAKNESDIIVMAKKDIPHLARWTFHDTKELEAALTGDLEPTFIYDDEEPPKRN